jgi:uncharacterized protein YoxC
MPPTVVWILVALAAILVGAVVPVLLQLRKTLQAAEQTITTTGRHVDETLVKLSETLERVNRASAELEKGVVRVSSLLEALGGVGDALGKVRASVGSMASIGASIGSVLIGALRAAFSGGGRDADPEGDEPLEREEMTR